MSSDTSGQRSRKAGTSGNNAASPNGTLAFTLRRPRGVSLAAVPRSASARSASSRTLRS